MCPRHTKPVNYPSDTHTPHTCTTYLHAQALVCTHICITMCTHTHASVTPVDRHSHTHTRAYALSICTTHTHPTYTTVHHSSVPHPLFCRFQVACSYHLALETPPYPSPLSSWCILYTPDLIVGNISHLMLNFICIWVCRGEKPFPLPS